MHTINDVTPLFVNSTKYKISRLHVKSSEILLL